jgi:hypothetical protein
VEVVVVVAGAAVVVAGAAVVVAVAAVVVAGAAVVVAGAYILVRNKQAYWTGGVWGDPGFASQEKGEKLCRLTAAALAEFVVGFENFTERD